MRYCPRSSLTSRRKTLPCFHLVLSGPAQSHDLHRRHWPAIFVVYAGSDDGGQCHAKENIFHFLSGLECKDRAFVGLIGLIVLIHVAGVRSKELVTARWNVFDDESAATV